MLVTPQGGPAEFYLSDRFDAQFIHNAVRNLEKVAWMLVQPPLLLPCEASEQSRNRSFAEMVALLTHVLEPRYRRMGTNYAQSLFLLNFGPVQ